MPRKIITLPPYAASYTVDCFAFYVAKDGCPKCNALTDVYCLKSDRPCRFRATKDDASAARASARERLLRLGLI